MTEWRRREEGNQAHSRSSLWKGGSGGRIKGPLRAFKGAPATPHARLKWSWGERSPSADTDRQRPEGAGRGSPTVGQCQAAILWPLYSGSVPTPRPGTSNGSSPHPDPAEQATVPSSLHTHKDRRLSHSSRGTRSYTPPPPCRRGNWGQGRPARGVMTQRHRGGVTLGQSPQCPTPEAVLPQAQRWRLARP